MSARPSRRRLLSGFGASALLAGLPATSRSVCAQAADFYQGKTLTVIAGFGPGGGVDTMTRLVARHLVRFIPGQPRLIVQNMEGAGGLVAANHLDTRAAPDGLTLGLPGRSWFVEGVVKSAGVRFDPTRFTWIGSPGAVNSMLYVRSSTGIKSFEELTARQQPLTVGALASTTPNAMVPVMLAGYGVPLKVAIGYGATARIPLALEQGEIDGVFTVEDSFARRQDLLTSKLVIPILTNRPTAGLPLLRDAIPQNDHVLLTLVLALENFGLPLVGPPGIPADRVDLLRTAFMTMAADAEYRVDAARVDLPIETPIDGAQLTTMINELAAAATPDIVAAYRRVSGSKEQRP